MKAKELSNILDQKKQCSVKDLARFVKNRMDDENPNYCFLLGAGASRTSGIYTAEELIAEWRHEAYLDFNEKAEAISPEEEVEWLSNNQDWYNQKHEYSSLFEYKHPLQKHRRVFIEKQVSETLPSIGYSYLVRLTEKAFFRTIFTTNFDDLLNEAFYQFSNVRPAVCAHDSSVSSISITSSRPKIIKLHGDYLFDGIKSTIGETKDLNKNMSEKFSQFLKEYGLIISGYSGSDRSIIELLRKFIESEEHLETGLYWCFRADDEVNEQVLEILKEKKVFYVIIDGFDELMADLYDLLCENCPPFNSQIATDRAQHFIDSYLQNDELRKSKSKIISKHLDQLDRERRSSEFFSAIQALNSEMLEDKKLNNSDLLKILEIERTIQNQDYEIALKKLQEELDRCDDQDFKKSLLGRLFFCAEKLNRNTLAVEAADKMLELESDNLYVILDKVDVLPDSTQRLSLLNDTLKLNDHYPDLINRLVSEKLQILSYGDSNQEPANREEIQDLINKSILMFPSILNPAWGMYYDYIDEEIYDKDKKEECFREVIEEHLKQDPYSFRTTKLALRYCKQNKTKDVFGNDIFDLLGNAFKKHFPKKYSSHFEVYSDACVEFEEYGLLRELIDHCDSIKSLVNNEKYVSSKINLQLDVYRNIDECISIGEAFLKSEKSTKVEKCLLNLYLKKGRVTEANALLKKLKNSIDYNKYFNLEADILEVEERYQDAIDALKRVPDKEYFQEIYTTTISYLYLKMGQHDKSKQVCIDLLDKHTFSNKFQVEIINYEFSKMKLGKKPSKDRLDKIIKDPKSNQIEAVALILQGDIKKGTKILEEEISKRFSRFYDFLRWPVLESVHKEILEFGNALLSSKRVLSKSEGISVFENASEESE